MDSRIELNFECQKSVGGKQKTKQNSLNKIMCVQLATKKMTFKLNFEFESDSLFDKIYHISIIKY